MPVAWAQLVCSGTEFMEWQTYYSLEPWGEERADWRAAMIAATYANCHRAKGKALFKIKDFFPSFGPRKPQTAEGMKALFKTMTREAGGKVVSRGST